MSEPLLAGTLPVRAVMADLADRRPVFHSEADFQFAFAQAVVCADPGIEVRLEVRQPFGKAEYVDLVCQTQQRRTLVELKYPTALWTGADPSGEQYTVRNHAAYDLARRYFIHDIARLEKFVDATPNTDGVAILLTNEPSLWTASSRATRYANFRIHEGQTLTGRLVWGTGGTPYDEDLRGSYLTSWSDYFGLEGPRGTFRYLALTVNGGVEEPAA